MILLIAAKVGYVPIVLPMVMYGVLVDGLTIAKMLFLQMVLLIVVGMFAVQFLPDLAKNSAVGILLGNILLTRAEQDDGGVHSKFRK